MLETGAKYTAGQKFENTPIFPAIMPFNVWLHSEMKA